MSALGTDYVFLYLQAIPNPKMQTGPIERDVQVIENKQRGERPANCYWKGASDVPAAGEYPGQPNEQQDPARATANEADPQKGKPAG
jgi:hypothetical protein